MSDSVKGRENERASDIHTYIHIDIYREKERERVVEENPPYVGRGSAKRREREG